MKVMHCVFPERFQHATRISLPVASFALKKKGGHSVEALKDKITNDPETIAGKNCFRIAY
jgi:hypothetical protein